MSPQVVSQAIDTPLSGQVTVTGHHSPVHTSPRADSYMKSDDCLANQQLPISLEMTVPESALNYYLIHTHEHTPPHLDF